MSIIDYFNDMDTIFEDLIDESIFDGDFDEWKNTKGKGYSILYLYETGMKEPEIIVKGEIDEKTVKEFLKQTENTFGPSVPKFKDKIRNLLTFKKKNAGKEEEIKEKEYSLELPGFAKDDLKVELKEDTAILTAKKESRAYEDEIYLPFKAKRYKVTADNGLFTIKFYKN